MSASSLLVDREVWGVPQRVRLATSLKRGCAGDPSASPDARGGARRDHSAAPRTLWPWLPFHEGTTLAPHPYCTRCGTVQFLGGRRALDYGGLVNLLARFDQESRRRGRRVTHAQRRLILQRLRALEADDTFGLSWEGQIRLIADVIGPCVGMSPDAVATYLRSC